MRWGIRRPSLKRRLSARTSIKRYIRHSLGLKAPRGYGWMTNPKKYVYNKLYHRTSVSLDSLLRSPPQRCRLCAKTLRSARTKANGLCAECEKKISKFH